MSEQTESGERQHEGKSVISRSLTECQERAVLKVADLHPHPVSGICFGPQLTRICTDNQASAGTVPANAR